MGALALGTGIASALLGTVSLFVSWVPWVGLVLAILGFVAGVLAVVFGILALKRGRKGMGIGALASGGPGLIVSAVGLFIAVTVTAALSAMSDPLDDELIQQLNSMNNDPGLMVDPSLQQGVQPAVDEQQMRELQQALEQAMQQAAQQ